jgi:hypothetical protein
MEPKLIKEEVPDRDTGSSSCSSNSKELSRGARQPTPPAHPEGGGGPASRAPRPKGKFCSIVIFVEMQLNSVLRSNAESHNALCYVNGTEFSNVGFYVWFYSETPSLS